MSQVRSIESLYKEGEWLGFSGQQLSQYYFDQQAIARAKRTGERDLEWYLIANALEKEKMGLEERNSLRQHEKNVSEAQSGRFSRTEEPRADLLKLYQCLSKMDNISTFPIRFELIAQLPNLRRNSFAVRLAILLS